MNSDNRPPPYSMRLDPDLRVRLEAAAKVAGRSLHAEISMRLEASLQEKKNSDGNSYITEDQAKKLIAEAMKNAKGFVTKYGD